MSEVEKLALVVRRLLLVVYYVIGTWAVLVIAPQMAPDATDASFFERSGMRLYTDHGTGCQYLMASSGNLQPRLDATGKHQCANP